MTTFLIENKQRHRIFWEADVYTEMGKYIGSVSAWTREGRDNKVRALKAKHKQKASK